MTRAKKAKTYPVKYANKWVLIEAIRLLQHMAAGKTLDSYPWVPADADEEPPIESVIEALKQIYRGDDARVTLGQTQGRGGNRKSDTRPIDIALAYVHERRERGLKVADACSAVRAKLRIDTKDGTIIKIERAQRTAVRERQRLLREIKDFDT